MRIDLYLEKIRFQCMVEGSSLTSERPSYLLSTEWINLLDGFLPNPLVLSPAWRVEGQNLRKSTLPRFWSQPRLAAVTLWDTVYLSRAVEQLRSKGEDIPD